MNPHFTFTLALQSRIIDRAEDLFNGHFAIKLAVVGKKYLAKAAAAETVLQLVPTADQVLARHTFSSPLMLKPRASSASLFPCA